jgi:selenocysteine lyase/cysteine desulfurase
MIFLDSAATTLQKPPQVERAVCYAVRHYSSPGRGGYATSAAAGELCYRCRELACDLFEVGDPERVVFTSSATHGLNIAIRSLVQPGGNVIISGYEHNAVTRTLESIPEVKATVLAGELFCPEQMVSLLEKALDTGTHYDAVILCYVSNVFGYVLPVEEMGSLCRRYQVPLIVDGAQAAGAYPIRLDSWNAAFVALPGHKGLYGPQGIGLLLCGQEQAKPLLTGGTGSDSLRQEMPEYLPDRLEPGTHNMPGIAGLYAGMSFVQQQGICAIRQREEQLGRQLVEGLGEIPRVQVFAGENQAGVVSFRVEGEDCEVLGNKLAQRGIALRTGLHCAPLAHQTAGTLESGTLRASVSAFTRFRDIDTFHRVLREELNRT